MSEAGDNVQIMKKKFGISFFRKNTQYENVEADSPENDTSQLNAVENSPGSEQTIDSVPVTQVRESGEKISPVDMVGQSGQSDCAVDYISDCVSLLKARNDMALARNRMFMERFNALRSYQVSIEEELGRVKTNPITLRAMSDWASGIDISAVTNEAARRRADTFSADSTSITISLRDFESQFDSWTRLAQLTFEVAMLAPLPELGRHVSLQKNVRIFLKHIKNNEELKIYWSEKEAYTLHDKICHMENELESIFKKNGQALEKLFRDVEQPLDFDVCAHISSAGVEANPDDIAVPGENEAVAEPSMPEAPVHIKMHNTACPERQHEHDDNYINSMMAEAVPMQA